MAGKHEHRPERPARRQKTSRKRTRAGLIIIVVLIIIALLAVAATFVLPGIKANKCTTIYPNVSVGGVNVGGMTIDEAQSTLESAAEITGSEEVTVILSDSVNFTVTAEQAGLVIDPQEDAEAAYAYGRDGGFFKKASAYRACMKEGVSLPSTAYSSFDEDTIRSVIASAAKEANTVLLSNVYKIGEDSITINKGATGVAIDEAAVFDLVRNAFESRSFGEIVYKNDTPAEPINLHKIFDQINTDAVPSVYDPETQDASESIDGVTFDLEAAMKAYDSASDGDTVTIPLIKTPASPTQEELRAKLFCDELASKSTTLAGSSKARINNVSLAAEACNVVLNPGDTFSFNGTVGERTAKKGYQLAGAYVGGESVDQLGGGICQCSSTIYFCVLKADLEVVERSNHMFPVSYLPKGFDATVNWGTLDFKFKNDTEYPIKIVAAVSDGQLNVSLLGTKSNNNKITLDNVLISSTEPETVYEVDETFVQGQTEVKTKGHTGYVVDAYKFIYDENGELIEKEYLSRDKYRVQNKVILISPFDNPPDAEGQGETVPGTDPQTPTPPPVDPETPTEPPITDDPPIVEEIPADNPNQGINGTDPDAEGFGV